MMCATFITLAILLATTSGYARDLCRCNELVPGAARWRLLLYAKDPTTWQCLDGGAWGEILIERGNGQFEFNASGLVSGTAYVLVHINEPDRSGELLGAGKADRRGELKFSGTWRDWRGKFWLITARDLRDLPDRSAPGIRLTLKAWNPSSYLFESEVIR